MIAHSPASNAARIQQDRFYTRTGGKVKTHVVRNVLGGVGQKPDRPTQTLLKQREDLRQAVAEVRIKDVIRLYDELGDKAIFNRHDWRLIVQCLHQSCRQLPPRPRDPRTHREETEPLVAFGQTLVKDLEQGVLSPNTVAHVHLLGFFKEIGHHEPGVGFWNWLHAQDDDHVNADVYGAAIELLAVSGTPLRALEDLYQEALARFPGNFVAYHLAPNAILPNRDEAVQLPGIPMSLLQGILSARLLRGDTRNAYLALDTALRLYPDQTPSRFFALFVNERPVAEAFTVLMIACRAGIDIPVSLVKRFQSALRSEICWPNSSGRSMNVRGQLSLLHTYGASGGRLTTNMLTELVISVARSIRVDGLLAMEKPQRARIATTLMDIIRDVLAVFARAGITPHMPAFNTIINDMCQHLSKQSIHTVLADAQALGLEPNDITRRAILRVAGELQDKDLIEGTWKWIVLARTHAKSEPYLSDWNVLVSSCLTTQSQDFARRQFEAAKDSMPSHLQTRIMSLLESDFDRNEIEKNTSQMLNAELVLSELELIKRDLQIIDDRAPKHPDRHDFSSQQLPMTILPPETKAVIPEEVARALYDELTTEASTIRPINTAGAPVTNTTEGLHLPSEASVPAQVTSVGASHTRSPTNIPLGTLRFENWKTINWLLEQSAANDQVYHRLVDEAISAGTAPPARRADIGLHKVNEVGTYGLCDAVVNKGGFETGGTMSEEEIKAWRDKVLALRDRPA